MLSDIPRQQLAAIYTLNGKVADDDKLCEAFLRDYCGECRREIAALSAAVRWGVPKSLREASQMPPATLRTNLSRRLEENQGLDSENALWAVDAWASVIRRPNGEWPWGAPAASPGPASPPVPAPAPANGGGRVFDWSQSPPPAVSPQYPQAPVPAPAPANGEGRVFDWSQSPPPAASPQYPHPAVAAGVLSPLPSEPNAPQPQPAHPQSPVRPAPQPMPGIPFAAAAAAFLAGEKSPDLKAVQGYLKMQLKIRKPKSLTDEIQAVGIAPGIARNMVNRVRRSKALRGLSIGILLLIVAFAMLGNGTDPQGEVTALGTAGFFLFVASGGYSLWSIIRIVRFS